jgi:hypothetical protein
MSQNEQYEEAKSFHIAFAESVVATQKRLADIHGPLWSARREVAKAVLSLASATLVLTVTFADKILAQTSATAKPTALAWVWLLLLASIAATLASLAFAVQLESLPARMISMQHMMFEKFREEQSKGKQPVHALDPMMQIATKPLLRYDQFSRWFLLGGLIAF